jgi:predicted O-methyltransferase YrrM
MKNLLEKSIKDSENFSIKSVIPALRLLNSGALEDVLNVNGCRYYQFLPCLIDNIKPHQVVELGGAMGVADIMMLQSKWQDYKLYSVTLEEHGLEFSMVADSYENLIKVVGDDLDLKVWPKDLDLNKTDLWFIDTLHTKEQLTKELELYTPFFKKGAIVLFDDIHMPELEPVWNLLCQKYDHFDLTDPCHYSGFGAIQI